MNRLVLSMLIVCGVASNALAADIILSPVGTALGVVESALDIALSPIGSTDATTGILFLSATQREEVRVVKDDAVTFLESGVMTPALQMTLAQIRKDLKAALNKSDAELSADIVASLDAHTAL